MYKIVEKLCVVFCGTGVSSLTQQLASSLTQQLASRPLEWSVIPWTTT